MRAAASTVGGTSIGLLPTRSLRSLLFGQSGRRGQPRRRELGRADRLAGAGVRRSANDVARAAAVALIVAVAGSWGLAQTGPGRPRFLAFTAGAASPAETAAQGAEALQRRAALQRAMAAALAGTAWPALGPPEAPANAAATAFANALPEAANYARKQTGVRQGDLGLRVRRLNRKGDTTPIPVLKVCPDQVIGNCFSTTVDFFDTRKKVTTQLQPWKVPEGKAPEEAMAELRRLVLAYPPGQGGVDKGGFRIAEAKPTYLYVQFASVTGLIDDVEFAVLEDGSVLVRSGSRSIPDAFGGMITSADGLSNAKRLNYLAAQLRQAGWTAPEITKETHPYYFDVNAKQAAAQAAEAQAAEAAQVAAAA